MPGVPLRPVVDPRTDYAALYDEAYYRGRGADPLVDYEAEIDDPASLRHLEWRGLERVVGGLTELRPGTRWLDMGCGLGGLVAHLRARGYREAVGHDEGHGADAAVARGVPVLSTPDLEARTGSFDVVTAVEVIEHVIDPMAFLRQIAALLAPGGVVLLTTGNVERVRGPLAHWPYVIPDIHVSFLGPTSLRLGLTAAGLVPDATGFRAGHADVIRYKVLKNLRRTRVEAWQRAVPWSVASRVVDRRYGVTELPIGRRPRGS